MITIVWLLIVAIMLIIEIFTMGLTTIWFSFGAVVAAVASAFSAPLWVQIVLFCVVSVGVMVLIRPYAVKIQNKNRVKTNIDEYIGQQAVVIEEINNQLGTGKVRYRGMEWMARSTEGERIPADELVIIESLSGVKLMVKKADK